MLRHELSCPEGRLRLSGLMLKDAGRNHHSVSGVDPVVGHEALYFADDGHKALIDQPPRLFWVSNALVAPYRNVHRFGLPPNPLRLQWVIAFHRKYDCTSRCPARTSENPIQAKFAEFLFHALG